MWYHINEEKDNKSFMEVERVLWGWNSSALFLKFGCVENSDMKFPLRLAWGRLQTGSSTLHYTGDEWSNGLARSSIVSVGSISCLY
jgi:hypothetical protein